MIELVREPINSFLMVAGEPGVFASRESDSSGAFTIHSTITASGRLHLRNRSSKTKIINAIAILAIAILIVPRLANAQSGYSYSCKGGYWVPYDQGSMWLCPNQQQAPRPRCSVGYYESGGYCVPNGNTICPGTGGMSCPNNQVCSSGGCIPYDATDCGNGKYCSGGSLCLFVPETSPENPGVFVGCGTEEHAAALQQEAARELEKLDRKRAEQARITAEQRLEEQTRRLRGEGEKNKAAGQRLDRDAKKQLKRLTSTKSSSGPDADTESPQEIFRRLRNGSILNRLNASERGANTRFTSQKVKTKLSEPLSARATTSDAGQSGTIDAHEPVNPDGMPVRQTSAPRYVLPSNSETALLPSPTPAEKSWVQDFAISGSTDPEKLPPKARERYEAKLEDRAARNYSNDFAERDREILAQCMSFGCSSQTRSLLSTEAKNRLMDFERTQPAHTPNGSVSSGPIRGFENSGNETKAQPYNERSENRGWFELLSQIGKHLLRNGRDQIQPIE